jgi:Fe-S cluster assembly protein SufD
MSTPLTARILEEYAGAARALPPAAAARRVRAIERLRVTGLPTSRDENWKYANLRPLERQRFIPAVAQPAAAPAAAPADLPAPLPGFARYLFVDGVFAASGSASPGATAARISPLGATDTATPDAAVSAGDERFALLNEAFATDGAAIHVAGGTRATGDAPSAGSTPAAAGTDTPAQIELMFVASAASEAGASYPRVELTLEADAGLVLVERHVSAGPQANFVNSAVTVELARGARLTHYRLQELNARSVFFDTLAARLAQDARYRLHGISTGAQSARSTLAIRLGGERAELSLAIAALGDRQQVQDGYAVVEHAAPGARTLQSFRGIAAGRSRVAFNGKIVVARNARDTDSRQSLRGLLAGPEAEIDVRPQLEIYNDEVRCSHGATAGKLDENMLFYLLSRGLTRDSAQRLLKWAFLEDVIAQIGVPALRRQIEERVAGQLRDEALRELL